jgi:uracil-DNA glycosylase
LTHWAEQGVLLLNAALTVEEAKPNSHQKIWTDFTDAVIKTISENSKGVIFLLWGKFAQDKKKLIDTQKHYVLEAAHPSPLAGDAFLGNKHFSKSNAILIENGKEPIDWKL